MAFERDGTASIHGISHLEKILMIVSILQKMVAYSDIHLHDVEKLTRHEMLNLHADWKICHYGPR